MSRINWLRYPRTRQEKAINATAIQDEDIKVYRVHIRNTRYLPSSWDDINRYTTRSWKAYRYTQYK